MNRHLISLFLLAAALGYGCRKHILPDGNLRLEADVDSAGTPIYSLEYKGRTIVAPSRMGPPCRQRNFLCRRISASKPSTPSPSTAPREPYGANTPSVRDHFRELAPAPPAPTSPSASLTLRFPLFDDGLISRYELPRRKAHTTSPSATKSPSLDFSPPTTSYSASPATTTPTNISGPRPHSPGSPKPSAHTAATARHSAILAVPTVRPSRPPHQKPTTTSTSTSTGSTSTDTPAMLLDADTAAYPCAPT